MSSTPDYAASRDVLRAVCPACGAGEGEKCRRQTADSGTVPRRYPHDERSKVRNPAGLARLPK